VNSGIYRAYEGLKVQSDALDIISNNLANVNTTGYKEDRAFFTLLDESMKGSEGGSIQSGRALNTSVSSFTFTNRDLDVALEGEGFFAVSTPQGVRYSRNGSLHRNSQSVLTTADNYPVLGTSGNPITLGPGKIQINSDGEVSLENARVDRLKIVTFDKMSTLEKQGSSLYRANGDQASERPSTTSVRSGYLETSNVNAVASVVRMVEIMRQFESIQKSMTLMVNDIDQKAIEKLGK
jgi:flagellar basal-body rod protein FlgF